FFRRHKCDGARAFSSLLDRQDVPLCVAMVIRKGSLAANRKAPVSEVAEESIRIAKPAESKEWAGSDFFGGKKRDLSCKAPEPKQSRDHASDRKSTRLNSSHVAISYAVFCLKKKMFQHQ